jgi:hypothetical protein
MRDKTDSGLMIDKEGKTVYPIANRRIGGSTPEE